MLDLREEWSERLIVAAQAHYSTSAWLLFLGRALDVATAAVAIVAAGTAYGDVDKSVVGGFSVTAAVLAILTFSWRPTERSGTHREFGAGYFALRRQLELLGEGDALEMSELEPIRIRWDDLSRGAPLPYRWNYRWVRYRKKRKTSKK